MALLRRKIYPEPDWEFRFLKDIDFAPIAAAGVTAAALDLDGTLLAHDVGPGHPDLEHAVSIIKEVIERARTAGITGFVILSNVIIKRTKFLDRVEALGKELGIPTVALLMRNRKPKPEAFARALKELGPGASYATTVMIGDQLNTDILGAKSVGMRAVWLTGVIGHQPRRTVRSKKKHTARAHRQWDRP